MSKAEARNLEELMEAIGSLDINPGALAAQETLSAGHPIYIHEDGVELEPGEIMKKHPDGRIDIVRFERGSRKELFVRTLA